MIRPPTTTVFTLPGCGECISTIRWLRDHGLVYRVVNLAFDPAARAELKALGHRAAPVVVTPEGASWSGHQPGLLACLLPADTDTPTDATGASGQIVRAAGGRDVTQRQVAAG